MDDDAGRVLPGRVLPEGVRDGDVLIYMGGRLLIVDHLIPEAFTIDLVALGEREQAERIAP
jgi:hypothetical protein